MPLSRRLPKFGFWNPFRVEYTVVNVAALAKRFEKGAVVDPATLLEAGMVRSKHPVKILAAGDLSVALTVKAHKFSKSAQAKIEAAGGSVEVLEYKQIKRKPKKTEDKS